MPPERKKTARVAFFPGILSALALPSPLPVILSTAKNLFFRFFVTYAPQNDRSLFVSSEKRTVPAPSASHAAAVGWAALRSKRLLQGCPSRIVFRLGAESCRSSLRDLRRSPGETAPRARSFRFTFLSRERKANNPFDESPENPYTGSRDREERWP